MKKISILGSTGSIGTQALDLLKKNNQFEIDYLYVDSNYKLLYNQIIDYKPKFACINNEEAYKKLKVLNTSKTKLINGYQNILEFIASRKIDLALNAIVGIAGLKPTLSILKSDTKILALANKESLVMAGEIVTKEVKKRNITIFYSKPVPVC